jgi:heat shock protein HtpX
VTKTRSTTFWDIEKQKTWRISALFVVLIALYFISVFILAAIVKVAIHLRNSIYLPAREFHLFGFYTIFVLIIALIAAILHWYYSNRNVVPKILSLLNAQQPDRHDRYHNIFSNVIEEISAAAGGVRAEGYILPTGSMNAFALADLQDRKVIGITEGLLSRASRAELQAVVAHEMAHIISYDCLETTITCSLFGMYGEALSHLSRITTIRTPSSSPLFEKDSHKEEITAGFLAIPVFVLLFFVDLISQMLNMLISREKEYRADAAAIRLTRDPLSLASVLYRIGTHWRGAGSVGAHIRPIFILNPDYSKLDEKEDMLANMFSTHPPLTKRLQIILDLAHADLNTIAERVHKGRERRTTAEPISIEIYLMAQHNNEWHGPFTLLQLQTLDWLQPETKIKITGQERIFTAQELPTLSYFFQKRQEPIWKIRRLCPKCREWLVPQEYEGVYLWRCAYCSGVLAEQSKLPRIFVREERSFTEKVQRITSLMAKEANIRNPNFNIMLETLGTLHCPKCGRLMNHKFYSYAYHVEIDECPQCRIIWFDADELDILQCLIERETP